MRVLWVTPTIGRDFGGPTTTVVNGLIAEQREGMDSELVTTIARSESPGSVAAAARLAEAGVNLGLFPRSSLVNRSEAWGLSPKLAVWLLRNVSRYDVVHLQEAWCLTSLAGAVAARIAGVPVVLTPHESLTGYDIEVASRHPILKLMKKALRYLYLKLVDQMILMSELERRDTRAGAVPVRVVTHAVMEREAAIGSERTSPTDGLNIAFMGRNVEKKRIDLILAAISLRPERNRRLRIAGPQPDCPYRRKLEEIVERQGLADRVEWAGYVNDGSAWLKEADLLAMPSAYEGFGMVAAEAMCLGLPVIVPERSGVAEIVSGFETGIVMPESSVEALDQALAVFEEDPDRLLSAGRNGVRAANERLGFELFASRTREIYSGCSAKG